MAWVRTYDIDTPDGSVDDPAEAADRMNEIKLATQERENVDHYWPLTGSEVSDDDAGEHRKITIRTLSAVEVAALTATKAYLYRLVTNGELYFKDAAGNTIQLTSGGEILSASEAYADAVAAAAEAAAEAAAAVATAAAITAAIAAYVTLSAYTNEDSDGNAMVKNHAYKAVNDGYVKAFVSPVGAGRSIHLYVGLTDDPFGAGDTIDGHSHDGTGNVFSVSGWVAKDEYFEIRTTTAGEPTIRWKSKGALSEPIDQD